MAIEFNNKQKKVIALLSKDAAALNDEKISLLELAGEYIYCQNQALALNNNDSFFYYNAKNRERDVIAKYLDNNLWRYSDDDVLEFLNYTKLNSKITSTSTLVLHKLIQSDRFDDVLFNNTINPLCLVSSGSDDLVKIIDKGGMDYFIALTSHLTDASIHTIMVTLSSGEGEKSKDYFYQFAQEVLELTNERDLYYLMRGSSYIIHYLFEQAREDNNDHFLDTIYDKLEGLDYIQINTQVDGLEFKVIENLKYVINGNTAHERTESLIDYVSELMEREVLGLLPLDFSKTNTSLDENALNTLEKAINRYVLFNEVIGGQNLSQYRIKDNELLLRTLASINDRGRLLADDLTVQVGANISETNEVEFNMLVNDLLDGANRQLLSGINCDNKDKLWLLNELLKNKYEDFDVVYKDHFDDELLEELRLSEKSVWVDSMYYEIYNYANNKNNNILLDEFTAKIRDKVVSDPIYVLEYLTPKPWLKNNDKTSILFEQVINKVNDISPKEHNKLLKDFGYCALLTRVKDELMKQSGALGHHIYYVTKGDEDKKSFTNLIVACQLLKRKNIFINNENYLERVKGVIRSDVLDKNPLQAKAPKEISKLYNHDVDFLAFTSYIMNPSLNIEKTINTGDLIRDIIDEVYSGENRYISTHVNAGQYASQAAIGVSGLEERVGRIRYYMDKMGVSGGEGDLVVALSSLLFSSNKEPEKVFEYLAEHDKDMYVYLQLYNVSSYLYDKDEIRKAKEATLNRDVLDAYVMSHPLILSGGSKKRSEAKIDVDYIKEVVGEELLSGWIDTYLSSAVRIDDVFIENFGDDITKSLFKERDKGEDELFMLMRAIFITKDGYGSGIRDQVVNRLTDKVDVISPYKEDFVGLINSLASLTDEKDELASSIADYISIKGKKNNTPTSRIKRGYKV